VIPGYRGDPRAGHKEVQQETIELSCPKAHHESAWQQTLGRRSQDRFQFSSERSFTKDAHTIAKSLASKKVSPKGPGSGMRMLLPISLIARDEASARFGAKCCSGLSESSPSRRKDQKTTHTRERPDRRSKLHQALLARSIRRPRWPLSAASRWRVGASQQGQLVARTTK
jgi:hypothetical protein